MSAPAEAPVRVRLPPVLRQVVDGRAQLEAAGDSIAAVIADVSRQYPALALHFFDERGAFRRNVLFLHDGEAIRPPDAAARTVKPGDEVIITNALAGG